MVSDTMCIFCFIVPALHGQICSPLEYSASHTEPTTHQEVPNMPPPQGEYCLLCDNTGGVRNHASSPPAQFSLFYCDCQSQHLCTVLQLFRVFAFLPKLSQMFSDVGCRHNILIDIDVVYICRSYVAHGSFWARTVLMITFMISSELSSCFIKEIKHNLRKRQVSEVKWITRRKKWPKYQHLHPYLEYLHLNLKLGTWLWRLTLISPIPSLATNAKSLGTIKVGAQERKYVKKCGEDGSDHSESTYKQLKCTLCNGDHLVDSRLCSMEN